MQNEKVKENSQKKDRSTIMKTGFYPPWGGQVEWSELYTVFRQLCIVFACITVSPVQSQNRYRPDCPKRQLFILTILGRDEFKKLLTQLLI